MLEHRETGTALKQQAVLFRASHHSGPLEVELTRRNIPFVKFGGLKFLEASHIKDVLASALRREPTRPRSWVPRAATSSRDWSRLCARLLDGLMETNNTLQAIETFSPPAPAATHWDTFSDTVRLLRNKSAGWPAEFELVCQWYAPHLERIHEDASMRQADLVQLAQIASGYPSRERFLTELTLDPPDATSDQAGVPLLDEDYLILSTIHSAKGQEWKSVFVLNTIDGAGHRAVHRATVLNTTIGHETSGEPLIWAALNYGRRSTSRILTCALDNGPRSKRRR